MAEHRGVHAAEHVSQKVDCSESSVDILRKPKLDVFDFVSGEIKYSDVFWYLKGDLAKSVGGNTEAAKVSELCEVGDIQGFYAVCAEKYQLNTGWEL